MKRLIVLTGAIIFSLFTINAAAQMMGDFKPGSCKGMMIEKLNLTDQQQDAVEQLRIEHQRRMIDLKADLQKAKLDLKELKQNGNYTRDDFIAKVKAISEAKNNIALEMANHKMDIYELLTDEQKEIFNDLPMGSGCKKMMMKKHKMMNRDF